MSRSWAFLSGFGNAYPLTVKLRLPDSWKVVSATQGGKSIPATVAAVDGGRFALVKAVPDKGEISVVRS